MEQALYDYYIKARDEGKKVKHWLFNSRAKQLVKELYQMKIFEFLINGFPDLPTVSKFHFVEKRIVHLKDPQSLSY